MNINILFWTCLLKIKVGRKITENGIDRIDEIIEAGVKIIIENIKLSLASFSSPKKKSRILFKKIFKFSFFKWL